MIRYDATLGSVGFPFGTEKALLLELPGTMVLAGFIKLVDFRG
jgi:hypothetical protein